MEREQITPNFTISCETDTDSGLVFVYSGVLEANNSNIVEDYINQYLEYKQISSPDQPANIIFNTENMSFIDSSGISALIRVRNFAKMVNCEFILRNPSERFLRVLEISGLDTYFNSEKEHTEKSA